MTAPSSKRILWLSLLLILTWDALRLDLDVLHLFGTPDGFPLRDHWLYSGLLHDGIRRSAWLMLLLLIASIPWAARLGLDRSRQWRWLLAVIAISLLVPGLKQISTTSCPWSLTEFGGPAGYVPHWLIGTRDGGPGGCFPSGHVVNAFAFLPGWALYREDRKRIAAGVLIGVMGVGLLAGIAQVVRGAHYPSHVLWSAWLCALLSSIAARSTKATRSA